MATGTLSNSSIIIKDMTNQELEKIEANEDREKDYSPEYPLGGMIEPYDIEREKELVEKILAKSEIGLDKHFTKEDN